jgi:hypothetical protein
MADVGSFEARLAALEAAKSIDLADLPIAALQRRLEQDWQPDANTLLQGGSGSITLLRDVAFGTDTLTFPPVAVSLSNTKTVKHGLEGQPRLVFCQAFVPVGNGVTRALVIEPDDSTFTTTQFQCRGFFPSGATSNGTWSFCWLAIR